MKPNGNELAALLGVTEEKDSAKIGALVPLLVSAGLSAVVSVRKFPFIVYQGLDTAYSRSRLAYTKF